ncbi:MAG: YggS family pyridoxal phosphate-dependent enzyme [Pontiellaceae bacterium]
MNELLERLEAIEERILSACIKAGRDRNEVKLLAVSKTKPAEMVDSFVSLGLRNFGENKVQEAQLKVPACSQQIDWHLIGHLQSNKAKVAAKIFNMIHTVDSLKLMRMLDNHAETTLPILIQVNVAGEAIKFGAPPEEIEDLINAANQMEFCEVHGLMTIPPFSKDPEKTREHFASLRALRDSLESSTGTVLPELSMGMSHDLEVAIEEGSTWIRVGTDLFGARG